MQCLSTGIQSEGQSEESVIYSPTLVTDHLDAMCFNGHSAGTAIWRITCAPTLLTEHLNFKCVKPHSVSVPLWIVTCAPTLNVMCDKKLSVWEASEGNKCRYKWSHTCSLTQINDHLNVNNVRHHSTTFQVYRGTCLPKLLFKCEICSASFVANHSLKRHMRTHSGERPLKCNVCQEAFGWKDNLKIHMRTGEWW